MKSLCYKMAKKIFSQDPETYVLALAEALKKVPEFEIPEWTFYVKSGSSRERPPVSDDFWYLRAASILRQLYIKGVVGVGRLRIRYGSRKDRGGKPDKFRKASGKIIRVILQQAEKAGFVEKLDRLQHGRRLTEAGRDFLDSIEVETKKEFDLSDVLVKSSVDNVQEEFDQEVSAEPVEQEVALENEGKAEVEKSTDEVEEEVVTEGKAEEEESIDEVEEEVVGEDTDNEAKEAKE
jgi:small subunit ribosomal protein S19e